MGMVAVNDLAESSFAGVTAQVQVYGCVGMANAAATSDIARNGFLHRPVTKKEMKKPNTHGLFHNMHEELLITAVITAMQAAPATGETNSRAVERQRKIRRQREEALKEAILLKGQDEYIECLTFHYMWKAERCLDTEANVKAGVKALRYKKDKEALLKDNIQMRWKGVGWANTTFSTTRAM